ncbi:MAG: RNA polymerase sigma factor [Thermoguttaceae bacterium]
MTQVLLGEPIHPMPFDEYDERLLRRLRRQDEDAFDRLVAAEHARVTRLVARLLGWPSGVEDVVQEVFLAAWRNLPRFRGESDVATWLQRIAINKCRSRQRRWTVRLQWLRREGQNHVPAMADPADRAAIERETRGQVRRSIGRLPPKYREVIVLHYLEEQSLDVIAALLNVRRNTIEVRLHRARSRLKEMLGTVWE